MYTYLEARCKKCGEKVHPVSIGKINEISKYDAYKKLMGLLTSREIIDIRKENGLSQTGLAKIIGCGEKNIARYENGAIQTKMIDRLIKDLDIKRKQYICIYVYDVQINPNNCINLKNAKAITWPAKSGTINYEETMVDDILVEEKYGTSEALLRNFQCC